MVMVLNDISLITKLSLFKLDFFVKGRPEHYVDRDRLIAVSFYGQVDIRQQMLKQRSFLTRRAQTSGQLSNKTY